MNNDEDSKPTPAEEANEDHDTTQRDRMRRQKRLEAIKRDFSISHVRATPAKSFWQTYLEY